jgi:hypothetical protein
MAATKKTSSKPKQRTVSAAHKEAMANGRKASAAVGAYLEALDAARPRRGRQLTVEQIEQRLADARAAVESETGVKRLAAAQHAIDLERRLVETALPQTDLAALEADFVEWAPVFAASKGISYQAFRATGVPAAVLKRAGIRRSTNG